MEVLRTRRWHLPRLLHSFPRLEREQRYRKTYAFWIGFFSACVGIGWVHFHTPQVYAEEIQDFTEEEETRIRKILGLEGLAKKDSKEEEYQEYFSSLWKVCQEKEMERVQALKPFLSRLRDREGQTVFLKAVSEQEHTLVQDLLRMGVGPLDRDQGGNSGLHLAAHQGDLTGAQLLRRVCEPNGKNGKGETALHLAIQGGHIECVKELKKFNDPWIDPDKTPFSPFAYAVLQGQIACFEALIEEMDREAIFVTEYVKGVGNLLHLAVREGDANMLAYLLGKASPHFAYQKSPEGCPPLHFATFIGQEGCVEALLNHGVQLTLDLQLRSPVHWAAIGQHASILKRLLEEKPKLFMDTENHYPIDYVKDQQGSEAAICRALLIDYDRGQQLNSIQKK